MLSIHVLRPVTRCSLFSCNLQRYFTLGRCEIGKYTFPAQFANTYQTFVTNLKLLRVELRCKLAGKIAPCDRAFAHHVILTHTFELLINYYNAFLIYFEMSISINKWNYKQMISASKHKHT